MPTNSAVNAWPAPTLGAVGRDAEADVARLRAEDADDRAGADDRSDDLGADVGGHLRQGNLPVTARPSVTAGLMWLPRDVAERVDGGDDDRAERQRDHPEVGHRERRVAVDDQGRGHRADADEDEEGGADRTRRRASGSVLDSSTRPPRLGPNVIRYMSNAVRRYNACDPGHKTVSGQASRGREHRVIQSVDRAVRILIALQGARTHEPRRDRRPPSDCRRRPCTASSGPCWRTAWSRRRATPRRYRLGPATLRLGNVYLDTLELRTRVAPWAEDLARRTGCAVRTGVLLLGDVVVVHHEPRPDGTRQMPEVGHRDPGPRVRARQGAARLHAGRRGRAARRSARPAQHDRRDGDRPGRPAGPARAPCGRPASPPRPRRRCSASAASPPPLAGAGGEVVGARRARRPRSTEWPLAAAARRRAAGRRPRGVARAGRDSLAASGADVPGGFGRAPPAGASPRRR